jgi:hypothetical protein
MASTDKTTSRSEGEQKLAATAAHAHAPPCDRAIVEDLAAVSTRLSDPGDLRAKQINWGYGAPGEAGVFQPVKVRLG